MLKKITVIICTLAIIFTMNMTSFLCTVHAADATLNDLYNILYSIDQALSAPSSNRSSDLIYRFTELKQDFEWLFGAYGDGQGDGHINYILNNESVNGSTMSIAMGDLITQQNEILMSLVSSYVDASDPDNIIVKPGLLDRLSSIASAVSSSASTDSAILSSINSLLSETQQIRSIFSDMNTYNIPLESLVAYNYFVRFNGATIAANSLTKYPMVTIKASVSEAYNAQRRVYIPSGQTLVIAFLIYSNDSIDSTTMPFYALNSDQQANIVVNYDYIAVSNTRRIYHVIVKNNNTSGKASVSFDFTYSSKNIIPFYVGFESLMSEEMQSSIMYYKRESNNQLLYDIRDALYNSGDGESWLQKIYNHLIGNPDPDNQYNSNKENLNDSIDEYVAIESTFNSNFSDNMVDVNDSISSTVSNLSLLSGAAYFISDIIERMYQAAARQGFSIIYLLPLILGIALFFIGRGGIVMRQGPSTTEYMTIDEEPEVINGTKYQMHRVYRRSRHKNKKG